MTDVSNTANSVVSGVVTTVETAIGTNATAEVTAAKTAATTEVTSLSTHWHIPVWAVLVVLGSAAWAAVHFLHIVL